MPNLVAPKAETVTGSCVELSEVDLSHAVGTRLREADRRVFLLTIRDDDVRLLGDFLTREPEGADQPNWD